MDPDQTAFEASNILVDDKNIHLGICALRVIKCEFSVYTLRTFM